MAAEQRPVTPPRSLDERPRNDRPDSAIVPPYRTGSASYRSAVDTDTRVLPLPYRIERTQLQARIAALERALETSENRRQAVIDRYERLLADRDHSDESTTGSEPTVRSLLTHLIDR